MGFMDKAKQAAQRAQQMLDEQQTKFNQAQSGGDQPGASGPGVTYDQHGRPVQPAPPASVEDPGPVAEPAAGAPSDAATAPGGAGESSAPATPSEAAAPQTAATAGFEASGAPEAVPAGDEPAAAAPKEDPHAPGSAASSAARSRGDLNATPDPFKPIGG